VAHIAIYSRGMTHHAVGRLCFYPTVGQHPFTIPIFKKIHTHKMFNALLYCKVTFVPTSLWIREDFLSHIWVHTAQPPECFMRWQKPATYNCSHQVTACIIYIIQQVLVSTVPWFFLFGTQFPFCQVISHALF